MDACFLFVEPLNKCSFIRAVISGISVKVQCVFVFGTGQQHYFVAVFLLGNCCRIFQTCAGITSAPIIAMGYYIFNKRIGSNPSC